MQTLFHGGYIIFSPLSTNKERTRGGGGLVGNSTFSLTQANTELLTEVHKSIRNYLSKYFVQKGLSVLIFIPFIFYVECVFTTNTRGKFLTNISLANMGAMPQIF